MVLAPYNSTMYTNKNTGGDGVLNGYSPQRHLHGAVSSAWRDITDHRDNTGGLLGGTSWLASHQLCS